MDTIHMGTFAKLALASKSFHIYTNYYILLETRAKMLELFKNTTFSNVNYMAMAMI